MAAVDARRLWALCRKEAAQIVRDPSSILVAFVLPMLLLFIFGFGINLDASRVRLAVAVTDSGAEGLRFAQALAGSPFIDARFVASEARVRAALAAGEVRGGVVLRDDFSRQVRQGHGDAAIQVLADGSEPNTANFLSAYVQGTWQVWMDQRARDQGQPPAALPALVPRYWFNPTTVSRNYLVPGSISVIMTIIGALLTSLVVAREWERGTMEALLATPVTRSELLLSKVLPYYVLGVLAMGVCVLVSVTVLQVPFRGSPLMLWLVTSLFLGSGLGLGLLVSTLTRNQFIAAQIALNTAFLPAMMLSGFVFEIASMPQPIRIVTWIVPARWFVGALQTLFLAGDVWVALWMNLVFLLLSALFWLGLTAARTPRRLDDR